MSDNDLIRRGDAVKLLREIVKNWSCGCDVRYCRCAEAREQWDCAADEIADTRALPAADMARVRVMRGGSIIVADGLGYDLRECTDRAYALAVTAGSTNPAFDMPPWFFTGSPYADQIKALGAKVVDVPDDFQPEFIPDLGKVWQARETIWDTYCKTASLIDTPAKPTLSDALALPEVRALVEAAEALGAMPEGYCYCSSHRIGDDSKMHEPECRDLRTALAPFKGGV